MDQQHLLTYKEVNNSKFMYFFQSIPLKCPPKMFIEINRSISRFLWAEKKIRVKISTLQAPTSKGGLNLPNFKVYYLAAQLRTVWAWLQRGNSNPAWLTIEQQLVKPMTLRSIPFVGSLKNLHRITKSQIVCHTFECWQESHKMLGLRPVLFKHTPLWNNPLVPDNIRHGAGFGDKA